MKIFTSLYNNALQLAKHRLSVWYLCALSTVESFILPYPPPDVMLAPMVLTRPEKAYYFAFMTTLFSVIGGIIGYVLGMYFIDFIMPLVERIGYIDKFNFAREAFVDYGVFIVFVAGFSPIPYKAFTIAAGVMAMSFGPFVLASFVGRGLRFLLVALFVKYLGKECDKFLRKYIDYIGYALVVLLILFILINVV